jgi:hypothetical protein
MRERLICAPFGKAPLLLTNIRLGWKGLPVTNTLAYLRKNNELSHLDSMLNICGESQEPALWGST